MSSESGDTAVAGDADVSATQVPADLQDGGDLDGGELALEDRLDLVVEVTDVGPCRKHVVVTVPEDDVNTIRDDVLGELQVKAQIPGFRVGKAPRVLLEKRFRDEIAGEIKQKVLMASMHQLSERQDLEPIGEPRLDVESLTVPDTGDFRYEFEVEVRPTFDLPDFSSFVIRRPTGDVADAELVAYREEYLANFGDRTPVEGAAASGDHVTCSIVCTHNGRELRSLNHVSVQLRPALNFPDATIEGFDTLMAGVGPGESRTVKTRISLQTPVVEMRGEEVEMRFDVEEIQRTILPTLDKDFLSRVGCETPEDLDDLLKASISRQIEYQGRQAARQQVLEQISAAADWDLPEAIVRQQTENALRREVLEMSQAGFTTNEIIARENTIRQNAIDTTRQALKEHFVLDRVATENDIECEEADIARELQMMSFQSGEPLRRIRSRLVKSGMIENMEAQLRERKAIDLILSQVSFVDVPREPLARNDIASIRHAICGNMEASLLDDDVDDSADSDSE